MLSGVVEPVQSDKKVEKVNQEILLSVKDIKMHFPIKGGLLGRTQGHVKAVDGVSFDIIKGETLGLVGESGCGKSTTGRVLLRLLEATSGSVNFDGKEIFSLNDNDLRATRSDMQLIFQDPFSSLNPRLSVGETLSRVLKIHGVKDPQERENRIKEVLELVGLTSFHMRRYPHEFSGGQRQRIGIARALILNPKLIVLDEPVSALDVSIQSQVVNLLEDLQEKFGLTYLFVSHGLNIVRHISDRVGVMYLGKMVELADSDTLFESPKHPYTQALISANPIPNPRLRDKPKIILQGDVPSPINPPSGCYFHTRCPYAQPKCREEAPEFVKTGENQYVACHYPLS
ncbi:ABC transporter ATP-binding protein [Pseudoneobacillus rhizosphaerae]|jgi:oligopeptide transport system ATP-binding protein|uniref:Vitamin B12 import ATP-binding protein BtuD n=1 Tax=Pseudoneobacillus rhizosphaerae TaxID=2880968 RepID=A0A9C7G9R1_9BACI|nr:oligopeptide/dipeptide ABC transporter ATP-binding protein [Pseudoneobacillus rhizosphaerae]CAG9608459.1 Vitamin B12 import ATP-binding protein BtuD [Pseudoneobacillus rhizosphaerae]